VDLADDPNIYEDLTVAVGCDLVWGFSLEPWDATGTTASFIVGGTPFAMTITVLDDGFSNTSSFDVHLSPAQLATLGLNVSAALADYVVRWTASDGSIQQLGYGKVLAQ